MLLSGFGHCFRRNNFYILPSHSLLVNNFFLILFSSSDASPAYWLSIKLSFAVLTGTTELTISPKTNGRKRYFKISLFRLLQHVLFIEQECLRDVIAHSRRKAGNTQSLNWKEEAYPFILSIISECKWCTRVNAAGISFNPRVLPFRDKGSFLICAPLFRMRFLP